MKANEQQTPSLRKYVYICICIQLCYVMLCFFFLHIQVCACVSNRPALVARKGGEKVMLKLVLHAAKKILGDGVGALDIAGTAKLVQGV